MSAQRPTGGHEYARGGSLQRKTVLILSMATVMGGLAVGATLSVGALLLAEVSGNDAISGLASALFNAGAAAAGIPLARIAGKRGRRVALVTGSLIAMLGALVAISGSVIGQWWVLAIGLGLIGVASAVQLLSRFTATDLAIPVRRARDLSLVVWAITVGAVVGPNLIGPGTFVAERIGITPLAGVFVFAFFAQGCAALVNWIGLRPDPLFVARSLPPETGSTPSIPRPQQRLDDRQAQFLAIALIAVAQAVMVAPMAMTPLHLMHHEGTPEIVGFTLSLHIAGMYALSPVFGTLAGRWGRLQVVYLGWAMLIVAILIAYFAGPSHLLIQVSLTLLGLGWGAVTVAGAALVTELTPLPTRTRRQGQSDTFMSASGALAGALSGVVFAYGDYEVLALATGAVLLVGIAATIQLTRRYRFAV